MDEAISFHGIFEKATTTIDGGWRISFNLLQSESFNVHRLAALRDHGLMIVVMNDTLVNRVGDGDIKAVESSISGAV